MVGGGTAGIMAALAAAQEGAAVTIVEMDETVGGVGIRSGVHFYYFGSPAGLQLEVDRAARRLPAVVNRAHGYHPDVKLAVVTEQLRRFGVGTIASAVVADVIVTDRTVTGLVVETDDEPVRILAGVTLDCTGNGDVAALAGAGFDLGRAWDGAMNTFSLVPRFLDRKGIGAFSNFDSGWVDPTDPVDVSRAYRLGRRTAWRGDQDPSNTHYLGLGPMLGVREGRRIIGDHLLTHADLVSDRHFDDIVLRCVSHHDTHARDLANESDAAQVWISILGLRMLRLDAGVPYRSLLPSGLDGILIGCRALSQDQDSSSALRMQRDMHKVGEVVGTAAAQAVRDGVTLRRINIPRLQQRLIERGILRPDELARPPRPAAHAGVLRTSTARPTIPTLIPLLATDDQSIAIWWLLQHGEAAVEALRQARRTDDPAVRPAVALCLGLLGDQAVAPDLLAMVESLDDDRPGGELDFAEPRWIAALIVLRMMGNPTAADFAIDALTTERISSVVLYLLHYLIDVADSLTAEQGLALRDSLALLLSDPDVGGDFTVQGSGEAAPTHSDGSSIRWGVDLTASYLLDLIRADGSAIRRRYDDDERAYVRRFSDILTGRLQDRRRPDWTETA